RLDGVVALLAEHNLAHSISAWVPADVPVFICDREGALRRISEAIKRFPTRAIVRVGVNNAFVDPDLIDRLVNIAEANSDSEYVSYCSADGCPVALSRMGIFAEWISVSAIHRAERNQALASEAEDSTRPFYLHPELFSTQLIPIPSELDRHDLRFTIDNPHDLEQAEQIVDALGPERLDWQGIAGLIHHHPHLRQRMACRERASDALVE
ncbi:MAG: hypothetical protein OET79_16200, partial [Nitrospirota bacterium]|nr:hypothetical protein [Nitrospirota bacterium]